MKDLKSMRKLADCGVIIEWNDRPGRQHRNFRQAILHEFSPYVNGLLRKGEAKFI